MPLRRYKHKLLLDEGIFPRKSLKRINGRYSVKHIKHDFNRGGIKDDEIYKFACELGRVIVTYNISHFKTLAYRNSKTGVIGVPQNLTPDRLDTKLNALLGKNKEKTFYGKYTPLG